MSKARDVGSEPHKKSRLRLLARLERGAAWTMDLRRQPEVYGANPADGVYELRKHGWDIRTLRAWIYGRDGLPTDFRDYYVLVRGSRRSENLFSFPEGKLIFWRGGKPVLGSMLEPKWRAALLKAWEREP